jgi:guanylate kinase
MRRPFLSLVNVLRSSFLHTMAPGEYSYSFCHGLNPNFSSKANQRCAVRDPRPIVISGPSGVGKGTLYKLLFQVRRLPLARERDP